MFTRAFFLLVLILSGCALLPSTAETSLPKVQPIARLPPKIVLVLGGGAVRGFAHIGVIKTLEAHGIVPDMVVGTSAGSVVGALYAGGYSGFELQKIAFQLEQESVGDWVLPDRGFIKGEMLQNFINKALQNRPIERLSKPFAAVATELQTGEMAVFRRGNTGMAVRASSSIPGVFQPVKIEGREYVDGGLVSPIPVRAALNMGADIVIAVDISGKPKNVRLNDTIDIFLQAFSIMGQTIGRYELAEADVVIRPQTGMIGATEFDQKHLAIMEGEKAALAALPLIRSKLQQKASGK
ncbi:putative esterase of the alpha-beta hydrolase superfamily [Sulfuricella denitrificans skB26]|uniref:Putative esterase of the alpha-beta hydrolase superfamily n=1 Tax=Sulfuricella denitrificans (strain DSM 22764 / NBRC 105220 / skB26) TaxID=1163617 RepID=S6ALL0_SULDS|nr:patatin-like phospholipase family protein [Sulfuricella denitrificans]BAN35579.1 putative esterase of the alpha-beta hydrolase superfamily [Sulfuricella denitrificans skB26]